MFKNCFHYHIIKVLNCDSFVYLFSCVRRGVRGQPLRRQRRYLARRRPLCIAQRASVHEPLPVSTESQRRESKAFITVWKATGFGNWGSRMVRGGRDAESSMECTWKLRPLSRVTRQQFRSSLDSSSLLRFLRGGFFGWLITKVCI